VHQGVHGPNAASDGCARGVISMDDLVTRYLPAFSITDLGFSDQNI
jgi:hypothetical protein